MSQLRRGGAKVQGVKETVIPAASAVSEKPKSVSGGSVWGKPYDGAAPRTHASSSSSSNGVAKAKMAAKTPVNIAALAARNLGGFVPNKIFVGGVPITCTEEQFKDYFGPYGAISKVELHALRGFGYITYDSVESVDSCLEKYEEHYLSKKWVEVKRSIPRELIDSYEREQRRLHAEYNESGTDLHTKADAMSPPSMPPPPQAAAAPQQSPSVASTAAALRKASNKDPAGTVMVSQITQLKEMGFSEEVAKRVLRECVWDVNKAIDRLLNDETLLQEPSTGASHGSALEGGSPIAQPAEGPAVPASPVKASAWGRPLQASSGYNSGVASPARAHHTEEDLDVGTPSAAASPAKEWPTPSNAAAERDAEANGTPQAHPAPPAEIPPLPASSAAETLDEGGSSRGSTSSSHGAVAEVAATNASFCPGAGAGPSLAAASAVVPDASGGPAAAPAAAAVAPVAASTVTAAPPTGSGTAPPRKRIERVLRMWSAEDASQMGVAEDEFVNVWVDTVTDHGWIHAERRSGDEQVGWLPVCVLQQLPDNQRWMCARQQWQAMDESQCNAEEGSIVIVWVSSKTAEGWTYAEAEEQGAGGVRKPGWLPAFCLEWNEE